MTSERWIQDGHPKQGHPLKAVLFLLLFGVGDAVVQTAFVRLAPMFRSFTDTDEFVIWLNSYPWPFLVVLFVWLALFIWLLHAQGLRFFGHFRMSGRAVGTLLIGIVLAFIVQIGSSLLLVRFFPEQLVPANQMIIDQSLALMTKPRMLLAFCVLAPVREEVITRGLLMRYLLPKWPWLGLFVSSFVFAALHLTTFWFHFLIYFALGFVMGWVYKTTGRLEYSIGLHAANNFVSILPALLA